MEVSVGSQADLQYMFQNLQTHFPEMELFCIILT